MSLKNHYGIFQNSSAFCILTQNGRVYPFGDTNYGGSVDYLLNDLSANVVKVIPNLYGFTALRNDGKVISWEYKDSNTARFYNINEENKDYVDIFSGIGDNGFLGIKRDGTVHAWCGENIYDTWNTQFINDRNKIIQVVSWGLDGFICLKQDGTLAHLIKLSKTSAINTFISKASKLKNIKKIAAGQNFFGCLTHSGQFHYIHTAYNIDHTDLGIRGRDGFLGDPSVLESGVKDFYCSKFKCFILKDDGSLHIIGRIAYISGNNTVEETNFFVKQYKKLSSGVKDIFLNYNDDTCICLKDDDTAVALYLDPGSYINDLLVNIDKLFHYHVVDKNGKVICLNPDLFNIDSVESQVSSGVVKVLTSSIFDGANVHGIALKSDGSIVTWSDSRSNYNTEWGKHDNTTYGLRDNNGTLDITLGNSGVVDIYVARNRFAILKDDGKMYFWGNNSYIYNSRTVLNSISVDISNSEYGSYNGILSNYSVGYYFSDSSIRKDNMYNTITNNSLSESKYNSRDFSLAGTMNGFTSFTPDLENSNIYIYNDKTNMGIIENNNTDIVFTLNNGLTKSAIESILNHNLSLNSTFTFNESNYTTSYTEDSFDDKYEKRKRRMQMVRTLFQNNFSIKTFTTNKTSLGFNSNYSKTSFKVMHTLNNTELTYNFIDDTSINSTTGFYIYMEENNKCNINVTKSNMLTFESTGLDNSNNQIYYIRSSDGLSGIKLKYTDSETNILNSYPVGPFKDGDKVILNNLNFYFDGGIVENNNTTDASYLEESFVSEHVSLGSKIPIFPGSTGYLGIANNNYLYSWGDMDGSSQWVDGSKDANDDWTSATTNRITDISNVYIGSSNYYAVLLKNGKIATSHYGLPELNDSNNVWYDNGVKKSDLTELNDIVELFCIFNCGDPFALALRQDGSIALWSNKDYFRTNNTTELSAANKENNTLRSSFAKRLMDSTDPNFSRIKKICVAYYGFIILREDGRIAAIDKYDSGTYLGKYTSWNRRSSSVYQHDTMVIDLPFTLGDDKKTLGNYSLNALQYLGNVIDIGTFMSTNGNRAFWYALNDRGQFFVFIGTYNNAGTAIPYYPPHDICYGDYSLEDPTSSPYFKKTVKVYSKFNNNNCFGGWLIIFEDGTGLTSFSETEYNKDKYTYTDVFSKYSWNYDTNNQNVKLFQPTDPIHIVKYYGPYVLLSNGYLRNITYADTSVTNAKYYNWNHHEYGIKGTKYGFDANEPEYGDISGVKQIYMEGTATFCVKTNGDLLVWGRHTSLAADSTYLTTEIRNKFTNVNKITGNSQAIAVLKNDGSVFCWGNKNYGGSLTENNLSGTMIPASSEGMTNFTLDEGVIDIFANQSTFTAVKSSGLITWGNSSYFNPGNEANGHTLDALANVQWGAKTSGFNSRTCRNRYSSHPVNSYNEYNYLDYPYYQTNSKIETLISSLISEGVDQNEVNNFIYFPKNVSNFDKFFISDTFYKNVTKDNVRDQLIKLFYEFSPNMSHFETTNIKVSLDSKINFTNIVIFKSNLGIIDLTQFLNSYYGFYIVIDDGNKAIIENKAEKIIFKLTRSGTSYNIEKVGGSNDISANKTPPFTSKTLINNFNFGFKNGAYSSEDIINQKYNCISTTRGAAAYLTKDGKVITWGQTTYGGISHHEDIFTNFSGTVVSGGYDIQEPNEDAIKDVVDIVSHDVGFVALKKDGTLINWGSSTITSSENTTYNYTIIPYYNFFKNKVKSIYTNYKRSIAALLYDNSVIIFGNVSYGGLNINNTNKLVNIKKIYPSFNGFAAINFDDELITWGYSRISLTHPTYGLYSNNFKTVNNITNWKSKLPNIEEFYSNEYTNVAIDKNGHIFTWGESKQNVYPASLKSLFNTKTYVNVIPTQYCFAAIDTSGGVLAWGHTKVYTDTGGQWRDISGDVSANVTRIVATDYDFMCIRNDNVAIGIHGGPYEYYGVDFSSNEIFTHAAYQIHLPPSQYIVGRYKLKDIRDIFTSKYGFAAIDMSYNVICWGRKQDNFITDIDPNKIHGGDLSGNEENADRPIAIFTNGMTWACLKENETVVTWEGTNTGAHGTESYKRGSNFNDPIYGINSNYWGGSGGTGGGAIRGGTGAITILQNVKNIIPYGNGSTYGGYIAICEDVSGNQSVVQWGSDHDNSQWKQNAPNTSGRGFRHVCEELNNHSKQVIGIKNNAGYHYGWAISNNENLHEYNFGDKKFTDIPTGFGNPLQTIEVINTEDVIADILKDISDNNLDISTNFIEEATKEENKLSEDIDEDEAIPNIVANEEQAKVSKVIVLDNFKNDPVQLRKQRTRLVKLVFSANPTRNKFKISTAILDDSDRFKKSKTVIYRVNFGKVEVNLKEDPNIDDSTGFFIPLESGDEATMTNFRGDTKFKIIKSEEKFDDDTNKYFIEIADGVDNTITLYRSGTYIIGSRPQGPFAEGDRARIAGVDVEFGSVIEGSPNYSFGDPYINPICGYPTKLPDKNAIYRMVQGFGLYINASVHKLSTYKQNKMKQWFYNKAGYSAESVNLITNGYYYDKFFISSEQHSILFDLNKETIFVKSNELEYFNIKNNYEYETQSISLKEKCNKYTISWTHKILGQVKFFIKIYENPQIDNGISIDIQYNANKCKGMLINNYKPKLMELSNIKELKSKKLIRKLNKCKHKFSTRKLVSDNEIWLNVKNT